MTVRRALASIADPTAGAPTEQIEEARAYRRAGNLRAALSLLGALHARFPNDVRVWHEQAHFCLSLRQYERAKGILEAVAEGTRWLEPQPLFQLGGLAERRGDYGEAIIWFQKALRAHAHKGDNTSILLCYGGIQNCLMRLGEREEAKVWTRRIMLMAKQATVPEHPLGGELDLPSQFHAALTALAEMDWPVGWQLLEARNKLPQHTAERRLFSYNDKAIPEKVWDGRTKERVLVLAEQGIGDTLLFSRYLPLVAARTERSVVVVVPERLQSLLQDYGTPIVVTPKTMAGLAVDSHCWIMSLPHLLGWKAPAGLHWQHPQLRWRRPLIDHVRAGTKPRIGICWHGEPDYANDKDRSAPSRETVWGPLRDLPAELVSLQFGEDGFDLGIRETAVLMGTLDCVVSVDTFTGHLAGTLGVPTVLLAETVNNYRHPRGWGLEETPWYPSMRVIRREDSRAWGEAMERAVRAVREVVGLVP